MSGVNQQHLLAFRGRCSGHLDNDNPFPVDLECNETEWPDEMLASALPIQIFGRKSSDRISIFCKQ